MDRRRQPAYRSKPTRAWKKPFVWLGKPWRAFRALPPKTKLTILATLAFIFIIVIPTLSYLYFVRDITDRERLMNRNSTGLVVMDRNNEMIYSFGRVANETFVTLDEISPVMVDALIASEDRNFYEHGGFSPRNIVGALIANVLNRDMTAYGGSTITQQLVKNNLLSNQKSFFRKYQELSISIAIERHYTKDEILELYLNSVYFGEGAFGIDAAAEVFFDTTPAELNLAQSSMLVGVLPAPSRWSPVSGDFEKAREQQEKVLERMVRNEKLSEAEAEAALAVQLAFAEPDTSRQDYAHHFTEMVTAELNERYGEEVVARSGYRVRTTIDLMHQKESERIVREQIARTARLGATNAGVVALDPKSGEIKALVGSVDWNNEQFGQVNMALAPRQPGSSFKPIYYAEAIQQQEITAATIIRDEPKTYGGTYTPRNFDNRFRGDITVRHALATSLNIPAIEVLQKLGVSEGAEAAQRMGISTVDDPERYGLSLALGTAETRLMDMTNAYAAFANLGSQYKPTGILEIEDKFGDTIYRHRPVPQRVQSPEASFIISSILSDEAARAPTFGNRLNISGRQVAVKTGTTNDNKDAWTIGYTPSVAVGVWVGDNQNNPMQVGGAGAAGPIWRGTLETIVGNSRSDNFAQPGRVSMIFICSINGSYDEFFIRGTEPSERCQRPEEAEAARRAQEEEERRQQEAADAERRRIELEEERRRAAEEAAEEEDEEDEEDEEETPAPDPIEPVPPQQPVVPGPGLRE
jgi:1A family penicillin-binding protein